MSNRIKINSNLLTLYKGSIQLNNKIIKYEKIFLYSSILLHHFHVQAQLQVKQIGKVKWLL